MVFPFVIFNKKNKINKTITEIEDKIEGLSYYAISFPFLPYGVENRRVKHIFSTCGLRVLIFFIFIWVLNIFIFILICIIVSHLWLKWK
jgi:hypothetical protein